MARATARTGVTGRNGGLKSAAAASRLGHAGLNVDVQLTCETQWLCHAAEERNTKDLCMCSIILREEERKRKRGRGERKESKKSVRDCKGGRKECTRHYVPVF